jgi:hypothetical protein
MLIPRQRVLVIVSDDHREEVACQLPHCSLARIKYYLSTSKS